jgi:hypothetical protein
MDGNLAEEVLCELESVVPARVTEASLEEEEGEGLRRTTEAGSAYSKSESSQFSIFLGPTAGA